MKPCRKCGQETAVGNRKTFKRPGKKTEYEHRVCPPKQPLKHAHAEAVHLPTVEPVRLNSLSKSKTNERGLRLFLRKTGMESMEKMVGPNTLDVVQGRLTSIYAR